MSKFKTTIQVSFKEVLDALPPLAVVTRTCYDDLAHTLTVEWEYRPWKTGYDFPMEMKPEEILLKRMSEQTEIVPSPEGLLAVYDGNPADVRTLEQEVVDQRPRKRGKRMRGESPVS